MIKTEQEEMNQTICLDFDKVLNSYSSGWLGDGEIPDPPVFGAKQAVEKLRNEGWAVKVLSTRCRSSEGRVAILEWLIKHEIPVDEVCEHKPAALVYLDDRAIRFNGSWKDSLKEIKAMQNNGGFK